MISAHRAWEITQDNVPVNGLVTTRLEDAHEFASGWYFPWRRVDTSSDMGIGGGASGIIVSKATGFTMSAGGGRRTAERDIAFFDLGYQAHIYDLVVLGVEDLDVTLDTLLALAPGVVELSYESGTVWRIKRRFDRAEIAERLTTLPAIFGDVRLYFSYEILEEAKTTGAFEFRAVPRRPGSS